MSRPRWLSLAFFKEWALLTLSLASGGFTVILGLGSYLFGKEPPKGGLLTVLQVCSIAAAWGAWSQERGKRLKLIERRKPRLKVPSGGFHRIDGFYPLRFVNNDGSPLHRSGVPFRSLLLRVENDPVESATESVATDIGARLIVSDSAGSELFQLEGRWSDSTQPPHLERHRTTAELKTVTIPIGSYRELDLVLKYNHEPNAHVVNNQSFGFDMLQNPEWRLGAGEFQIRVHLRGPNVDQRFVLKFLNPKGDAPLEPLSCEEVAS